MYQLVKESIFSEEPELTLQHSSTKEELQGMED
jgi:hypothetical protein